MTTSRGNAFSVYRQQYPDPFLDVASTKLPKSRKKLLDMLYLFATTHPQISPIVKKLAKYPITNVIVNTKNSGQSSLEKKWLDILENDLNVYEIAEGMGLDYMGYGNCFITVHKPFVRTYKCKTCGVENPSGEVKFYIRGKKFFGKCPSCKSKSQFAGKDNPIKNVKEVSIVRIAPQQMYVRYNPLTGKSSYYRKVPGQLRKAVTKQNKPDRELINSTPWIYVQAALNKKKIKFGKGKVLHLKEPSLSGKTMHWGMPIIMAALKDAYLNQIYKKADETVANERTVPARFVFPQATSSDPFRTIALSKFANFMGRSLRRYRHDKNAVMPVPFPVGVAEVGGDAQRLFTANVRDLTIKEIIGSTGVPEGFLGDGMTWSGGSVQLRMLENMLMSYLRSLNRLLNFVVTEVSKITELPSVEARFKPFKMADDVQMLQMLMQLAQMKHVSFKEILDRMDLDWEEQHDIIQDETEKVQSINIKEALTEVKTALEAVNWQVEAQQRQSSSAEMIEELNATSDATVAQLWEHTPFDQAKEDIMESKAEEAPPPEEQLQAAKAEKMKAEAEQRETETDLAQQQYQVAPVVDSLVQRLITMNPQQREKKLRKLSETAPTIARQAQERITELTQEESKNEAGVDIVADLRMNSKNPKEMADRILMLPPELKSKAFDQLMNQDPQLAIAVMKELQPSKKGGGTGVSMSSPDTRPQPKQKPPRRKS